MTGETVPEKKIRFYTTGYAGKDVYDLKPLVDALGAMLVDVRFSPRSETLRWRPVYLKALLRDKYHHVPQLGNRPSRGGKIQIQNLELGLKVLISFNESVILLCECAGTSECHRFLIARELGRKGFETKELENWK